MSSLIEKLTPIWERVLQRTPIRLDDNFFDLGGDSSLALKLFTEIAQACGRELPPVMIYQAPTITALAEVLEQPSLAKFPPLVQLKAGSEEPPVFIAHGMGGNVMDFFQLVKHIHSAHPIYGMQAKGIDGIEEPFERIEDMAGFFLKAIRALQPSGPYLLVGYSLGGLVTLEIAQRLTRIGEKVGLLAMLESYPHRRYLSVGQRLRLFARNVGRHAHTLARLPMCEGISYLIHPAERLVYVPRNGSSRERNRTSVGTWFRPATQRMRDRAYLALKRYQPHFYPDKIKFVRAESCSEFPDDAAAVWACLAQQIEVETVPGDHLGIINKHFQLLGAVLSRYLREATEENPCRRREMIPS